MAACIVGLSCAITVDIDPDTLNLYNNEGNYITAYIEGPFDSEVLFADDFELGWVDQYHGEWKVVQEPGTSNHVFQACSVAPYRGTTILKGDTSWGDYTVEARVYTTDTYWGLIVRADSSGATFYSTYLNTVENVAEIWKHTNGMWERGTAALDKAGPDAPAIDPNLWYDMKVVVAGSKIDLFYKLDGAADYPAIPQASAIDAGYGSGRIGLVFYDDWGPDKNNYVPAGKVGWFDDICVTAASGTVLDDDFESQWMVVPGGNGKIGQWIIEKDLTTSGAGHSLDWVYSPVPAANIEEISVVCGDVSWTDYALEYKVKISSEQGGVAREGSAFVRADANAHNGYLVHPEIGGVAIWKLVDDGSTGTWDYINVVPKVSWPIAQNTWYSIRAEAVGSTINVFVDGDLVVTWTDTVAPVFSSGKIGVRLGADARHAHFDDVVVKAISNDLSLIDVSSLKMYLDDVWLADAVPEPATICDHDLDGTLELMVKFPRADVVDNLRLAGVTGGEIELTIVGESTDGVGFSGSDSVRTIAKGKLKL